MIKYASIIDITDELRSKYQLAVIEKYEMRNKVSELANSIAEKLAVKYPNHSNIRVSKSKQSCSHYITVYQFGTDDFNPDGYDMIMLVVRISNHLSQTCYSHIDINININDIEAINNLF